ncbi:2-oxo acid dehydrogenase subunit E2 [Microbispora corallina]|uniref:Dihydrolipoamide acetyltransferase component of pyruvate dehydrogenase complex n=1 Tax=Microbispora corallina TaxID=83302 RepID=A0ABQ4FSA1_9ACTN|nr:2-oxo acid dehydrogenase subunit E2 [Microbispora corallina]GIH37695.1 dihydrolipoamide acetyltransferase component of pyruvate dehydrogenase complex [Microbispora corallina]
MTDIRVPKLNNNDTSYVLVEWVAEDGGAVASGDPVAVLETSKATEELVAEEDGYLWRVLPLNADCAPGDLIARLTADATPPADAPSTDAATGSGSPVDAATGATPPAHAATGSRSPVDAATAVTRPGHAVTGAGAPETTGAAPVDAREPVITAPARALIEELGVDPAELRALGVPVVRRTDVERLAAARLAPAGEGGRAGQVGEAARAGQAGDAGRGDDDGRPGGAGWRPSSGGASGTSYELSRVQRAVARAVRASHETIPAAYTVMRIDVGDALALAARLTREVRRPVGLPELVTCAVARLHAAFPLLYATLADERTALLPDAPHIGVTMDAGAGLFVPVIHDAGRRSLKEVAARLMEYRLAAATGDFREDDLAGANIVVTLHHDGDVTLAIPLIFPGHACALAVASPQEVLQLRSGEVVSRTYANIGLAYDHRLVNGRDAALYLRALKDLLEDPESTFA